jgi:hypothetical protein
MNDDQSLPKRGRPPLDDTQRTLTVSVRMTPTQYDTVCRTAVRTGVSVAEVIRRAVDPKVN